MALLAVTKHSELPETFPTSLPHGPSHSQCTTALGPSADSAKHTRFPAFVSVQKQEIKGIEGTWVGASAWEPPGKGAPHMLRCLL